jgi:maltose alpha-D-glucosyltransferase/alpha-amylase
VQAYVTNQGDAWAYTLDYLGRYLEERRVNVTPEPVDVHGAYVSLIKILGARTAELHLAFAQPGTEPAFAPEPLTDADLAAYREKIEGEVRSSLRLLESGLAQIPDASRKIADTVLAAQNRLIARVASFIPLQANGLKTRYHGDFHLGQALLTKNDFLIIDFEGEPGRAFDERRAKQPPMRDVAGMLRSFNYARWSALRGLVAGSVDFERLTPLVRSWEMEVRQAFVSAYNTAAAQRLSAAPLQSGQGLLGLFELEKALYEVRYELANRPDWAAIPLNGIIELLDAA